MNNIHIPILSYVFIGVTSLVLTYATIADTENEIIIVPTETEESPNVLDSLSIPSVNETIDAVKSLNPFYKETTVSSPRDIPIAVPVIDEPIDKTPRESSKYGGKKKQTREKKLKNSKTKKHHK
tara:strand:- start:46 stop:417 length:372 start_codon:yes stop_codon:yes gene_type:complete